MKKFKGVKYLDMDGDRLEVRESTARPCTILVETTSSQTCYLTVQQIRDLRDRLSAWLLDKSEERLYAITELDD